jgi:hypothetical protein
VTAVARRTDPATSHAAASSVENLRETQRAVLELVTHEGPMTDEELARAYEIQMVHQEWRHQSPSGLRTRRSELVQKGLLEDSGEKRVMWTGRKAIVWQLATPSPFHQTDIFEALES